MTKKQFLLKMNMRLITINPRRRNEILNHYRSVIDQSMANGNTEESSVEALGSINSLCRQILRKEKSIILVPILFSILNVITAIIKVLLTLAIIALLVGIIGVAITCGYSLVMSTLEHFIPSSVLLSSNMFAAVFKAGACIVVGSALVLLAVMVKAALTAIIKIIIHLGNMAKDAIYMIQSTKIMKEAFKGETVD